MRLTDRWAYEQGDKWPRYTSPGSYTLIYVTHGGDILCAECAKAAWDSEDTARRDRPTDVDTYDEGPVEHCAGCNEPIESSYGDPDAPVYIIEDWAGNVCFEGREFANFDAAWEYICAAHADDEAALQEYEVVEKEKE